ncbi:tetratricopeptide repeat protein [Roseibacterium sp. SDUM158017]|uniref:tetratricopeptide repeat protein n=1 Tax=Roseicyclus salinarum TaxID=3036773 RepID=UPI002414D3DA|nr:tetratricopeptide repeat protein [Roseibacterium sp. SDUM158017]MDG4648238.1 tetratricopeptide repeat protein [Roseibacterium sp. SDUM158017]
MSPVLRIVPAFLAVIGLAACDQTRGSDVDRALDPLNVIDQTNLSDVMLSAASPDEAVSYFRRTLQEQPDRPDLKRGLAKSLVRAGRAAEALPYWSDLVAGPDGTQEDRLDYADALIRNGDWEAAEAQLDLIPPTLETYERYRLEAMVADSNSEWDRAESFYETAAGLTTRPAGVLNNWGFSRLTRGDHDGAEDLFLEAITYDPDLFTAKNNLVLARAAQGNYQMPLVRMTQIERAQLLHTAALAAIRQGQVSTGRNLLAEAIDTHPQHFDAAVRALRALDQEA